MAEYSYESILQDMTGRYRELTGDDPAGVSDIGIRLKVLAGEIYSLRVQADWLKQQVFFETAAGEMLDRHALQRGLTRKKGTYAAGRATVRLTVPVEYEVTLPVGTVFATGDGALLYESTQAVTIPPGERLAVVPLRGEETGRAYHLPAGRIKSVVTPFSVHLSVTASTAFSGGTDDESDEELRERIRQSIRNLNNGMNKAYYIALAKSVDEVEHVLIEEGSGDSARVYLYACGRGASLSEEALSELTALIRANKCPGTVFYVSTPPTYACDVELSIAVRVEYDYDEVKVRVEEAVRKYFLQLEIDEQVTEGSLSHVVLSVPGVRAFTLLDLTNNSFTFHALRVLGGLLIREET